MSSSPVVLEVESSRLASRLKAKSDLSLSDFKIISNLGEGSIGSVTLVKYTTKNMSAVFALKSMSKSSIIERKRLHHIQNEKKVLEQIDHPFLIKYYTSFKCPSMIHMLFEYVPGGELYKRLKEIGRFSEDQTLFYTSELLCALRYLHSNDIIHRDLKLENILIDNKGHVKITDFGFSKIVPDDRTFTICGTQDYFAPEVLSNKDGYGKSADWWAFGILLYEMSVGYNPFSDKDPMLTYSKIVQLQYDIPRYVSASIRKLIQQLLTTAGKRIGVSDNGESIMHHEVFRGVSFEDVLLKRNTAPWKPEQQNTFSFSSSVNNQSLIQTFKASTNNTAVTETDALFADF